MTTLTHLEFRRKFTLAEQELADELEATFEASSALTTEQKRGLRTGYKNFYAASGVDLADPAIPPMLGLYTALGILAEGRAADILRDDTAEASEVVVTKPSIGAYLMYGQITVISEGETPPESYLKYWPLTPELAALIDAGGAQVRVQGDALEVIGTVQ
mgnify:CR=1 FL=1